MYRAERRLGEGLTRLTNRWTGIDPIRTLLNVNSAFEDNCYENRSPHQIQYNFHYENPSPHQTQNNFHTSFYALAFQPREAVKTTAAVIE